MCYVQARDVRIVWPKSSAGEETEDMGWGLGVGEGLWRACFPQAYHERGVSAF